MAKGEKLPVVMASQVGKPNGVAGLDEGGKVPEGQLPAMNYDPAGSAAAVQANLEAHAGNRSNPHGVTAQQVGAFPRFAHSTNKDFNTLIADGVYECQGLNLNTPYGSSGDTHFFVEVYRHADTWVRQIAQDVRTNTTFQRGLFNGVWGTWTTIADSVVAGQTTNSFWKKIFERTTAGAFEWTAPDLFGGKPYLIGCLIIGGGGSGGLCVNYNGLVGASGGASGYAKTCLLMVSPNQKISGVVGAGGAAVSGGGDGNPKYGPGNAGGSSSFNGCAPFEIPDWWRWYITMDYGLDMLAAYLIAVDDHGRAYVVQEVYEGRDCGQGAEGLIIKDAAERVKQLAGGRNIYEYLAPPDLWNRRQETGKSVADIFAEHGVYLTKTSNDRVAGWLAVKEWLKVYEDEQGIQAANLRIFPRCTNLIRCLPQLQYDEKRPSDVANEPHELTHGPDAIRGFCVYWTTKGQPPKAQPRPKLTEKYKPVKTGRRRNVR